MRRTALNSTSKLFAAAAVSLPILLSACVSRELLVETERKLENCAGELRTCQTDLTACESDFKRVQGDLATKGALSDELAACLEATKEAEVTTNELEEREASLREKLATEIAARDVQIKNLEGRLSIQLLDRILFRSGSAAILPEGKKVLDKVANVIKGDDSKIRIEGHTDTVPIGPDLQHKYFSNWELSGGRAASVVRYFEGTHEIEPTRMEAVGHSKYWPVAPNDNEENRQKNRRVEIVLTAPDTRAAEKPAPGSS